MQPKWYAKSGEESKVYKLNKAIYFFKQAAIAWKLKIHKPTEEQGFKEISVLSRKL